MNEAGYLSSLRFSSVYKGLYTFVCLFCLVVIVVVIITLFN